MKRLIFIVFLSVNTICSFGQSIVVGNADLSEAYKCLPSSNESIIDDYDFPDFKAGLLYYKILEQYNDTLVEVYPGSCRCDEDVNYSQLDTCIVPDKVFYNGKMYTVYGVGFAAFSGCSKLKKVILPNTMKYIAPGNFEECDSIMNITIPPSVKQVGKPNWGMNEYVQEVYKQLPDSVERILVTPYLPW